MVLLVVFICIRPDIAKSIDPPGNQVEARAENPRTLVYSFMRQDDAKMSIGMRETCDKRQRERGREILHSHLKNFPTPFRTTVTHGEDVAVARTKLRGYRETFRHFLRDLRHSALRGPEGRGEGTLTEIRERKVKRHLSFAFIPNYRVRLFVCFFPQFFFSLRSFSKSLWSSRVVLRRNRNITHRKWRRYRQIIVYDVSSRVDLTYKLSLLAQLTNERFTPRSTMYPRQGCSINGSNVDDLASQ